MLLPATCLVSLLPAAATLSFPPFLAPPATGGDAPNPIISLIPMALIFVIFYFLLIRPQQQQVSKHKEMLKGLKKGDRVVTQGGVYGRVTGVGENDVTVQIAKDVEVQMQKSAVTGVLTNESPKS